MKVIILNSYRISLILEKLSKNVLSINLNLDWCIICSQTSFLSCYSHYPLNIFTLLLWSVPMQKKSSNFLKEFAENIPSLEIV